jgi:hypothetical protein
VSPGRIPEHGVRLAWLASAAHPWARLFSMERYDRPATWVAADFAIVGAAMCV